MDGERLQQTSVIEKECPDMNLSSARFACETGVKRMPRSMTMALPSLVSRVPRFAQEESEQVKQLVGFRIGEEEFGVDILMVQEIIRLPTITPIPNAPGLSSE